MSIVGDPFDHAAEQMRRYAERAQRYVEEHYAGLDAIRLALDALPEIEPLPALPHMAYPSKLTSEGIHLDYIVGEGSLPDHVRDLTERINAEAERVHRLLPPAPEGYEWRWEVGVVEDLLDATYRIRWVLRTPSGIRWQP